MWIILSALEKRFMYNRNHEKGDLMAKVHRRYGKRFTILLAVLFVFLFLVLWSLFISGPNRIYEEQTQNTIAKIEKKVENIQGLMAHQFDYLTYQGYTEDTLYWFDAKGEEITTRAMETLDYEKARKTAADTYGIEVDSVQLGYGYDNPVYQIEGSGKLLLLDYDTLVRVYEREAR